MAVRSQEMRNMTLRPVVQQPRVKPAPSVQRSNAPIVRPITMQPSISLHSLAYAATILLAVVAIYAVMGNVLTLAQSKIDDMRYGPTRTYQLSAVVGHEDSPSTPTHLLAMNVNRQVMVIEIPGGDPAKTRTLTGPYLFGANEDKTPVLMRLNDLNADGTVDLIVSIKNEEIVYMNRDGQFQLITAEERQQLTAQQ